MLIDDVRRYQSGLDSCTRAREPPFGDLFQDHPLLLDPFLPPPILLLIPLLPKKGRLSF